MAREGLPWFGARLRQLRERAGLTTTGLAAAAGISQSYTIALERGDKHPTLFRAVKLAEALGVGLDELCREPEGPETPRPGRGRPKIIPEKNTTGVD